MADGLDPIRDAIADLVQRVTTELDQLAQMPQINPADVTALADSIRAQGQRISAMIPDPPTP
jgi:hypothetical protein